MVGKKTVFAMLLLNAPLAALAGCAALPVAPASVELDSAALVATPADELSLAPIPPLTHKLLLATPFHVLVSDEQMNAEPTPVIEVQAAKSVIPQSAPEISCGLAGAVQSIAHPAGIWRELAPLHADSNTDACLRSAAAIEHLPEALAHVQWYQ